jgi:hypothetical protein
MGIGPREEKGKDERRKERWEKKSVEKLKKHVLFYTK